MEFEKPIQIDEKQIAAFVDLVREIVKQVLNETKFNSELYYDGKVINGGYENEDCIKVDFGDFTRDNIVNKTGEELNIGDFVRVYTTSQRMVDAYVGMRL